MQDRHPQKADPAENRQDRSGHAALKAALGQASDPQELLSRIVAQALVLVPAAEGATVELADGDELIYVSCGGALAAHVGLRLRIEGSFSGLSVRNGEVLRCDNSETDPRVDRQACRAVGAVSMLCVPLSGPTDALGVLKVASAKADAFGDDDVAVLGALAPFVTAAVSTASDLAKILPKLAGLSVCEDSVGGEGECGSDTSLSCAQEKAVTRFVANVMRPGMADELEARQAVLGALAPDAMRIFAQPIYRLDDGCLWGVEALARFKIPPLRPPDVWFGEARRLGLDVELELAAIRKALELLRAVPNGVHLAMNLGPRTLCDAHLDELLEAADPRSVVLELTEHIEIDDYTALQNALKRYRRRGIKLAVDDAGAGISGLTHILRLAPDYIKLDRELTGGIEVDPVRRSLATALVKFASESGAEVIAEGIENAGALAVLSDLNVGYGQGYHLGRPAPITRLKAGIGFTRRDVRCGL